MGVGCMCMRVVHVHGGGKYGEGEYVHGGGEYWKGVHGEGVHVHGGGVHGEGVHVHGGAELLQQGLTDRFLFI